MRKGRAYLHDSIVHVCCWLSSLMACDHLLGQSVIATNCLHF